MNLSTDKIKMAYTFFVIMVPDGESPTVWAKDWCDAFGFDYDLERSGVDTLCAWPIVDEKILRENLEDDEIIYRTFQVDDLDKFFGLD